MRRCRPHCRLLLLIALQLPTMCHTLLLPHSATASASATSLAISISISLLPLLSSPLLHFPIYSFKSKLLSVRSLKASSAPPLWCLANQAMPGGDCGLSFVLCPLSLHYPHRLQVNFLSIYLLFTLHPTGGVLSKSLAIATDAAHLLTDFASFMISLFSIWIAGRPSTQR